MPEHVQQIVLWLIPAAPLVAAVVTAAFGPAVLRHRSHLPCLLGLAFAMVCAFVLLVSILPAGLKESGSAAAAAKKAFVVNRIGDFGFITAVFLIWTTFHSLDFAAVLGHPEQIAQLAAAQPGRITLICLLLFLGACGKSAQFPLHVWLPDAMEGPTPVSALIHAATMVTSGGDLRARWH